ncbi:MAG: hypothetical protein Q9M28_04745 [Mariprofundaceae bacterium]|nr:hypothetical protein [Mariprofundaceae bacterium]
MKKFALLASLSIFLLMVSTSVSATEYSLTCENVHSGQSETVKVEADSRSKAVSKTKNDPGYSDYKNCK